MLVIIVAVLIGDEQELLLVRSGGRRVADAVVATSKAVQRLLLAGKGARGGYEAILRWKIIARAI